MSNPPPGWHTVTPRIFADDPEGLVGFIKQALEATGDYQTTRPSEIRIGDSIVMISGTEFRPRQTACLYVYVNDVDEVFERSVNAGVKVIEAPTDMPYGDRRCTVEDAWGNVWQIATRTSA
jgi:PhnB protein